ncbi:hypothetical protein ACFQI3_09245 [Hansschlegelia quercus]|uniref:DUF748 domain-containing protein n=1 Tax=Hansschlegelia quercus TaxID=2528245 RepID=A0A4Q9GNC9_9HYPH|nr:hypothetical protein [Hansschlegelia quercus]TBN54264.1 hypothetical protein EYR15_05320 [Hansschlegelia quercus]
MRIRLRTIIASVAALAALAAISVASAPTVAQYVAEREVDKTLGRIRRLSTAVADRGEVSVDIGARSVTVHDISIDPPGGRSRIQIGSLTIVRPWQVDDNLTAERVVAEHIRVESTLGETIIPRFEARDYSGLSRGLVATPGIGSSARSQAEIIASISSAEASAPSIEITETRTKITRTFKDVTISRISNGVLDTMMIGSASVTAPNLKPGRAVRTEGLTLTGSKLVAKSLSLPTLWRFYAGDGAGDREVLLRSLAIDELTIRAGMRPDGAWRASAKGAFAEDFRLRALGFPFAVIDDVIAKLDSDEPATPADNRQRIAVVVDAARAFSFASIGAREITIESRGADGARRSGRADSFALEGYADARLERIRADGVRYAPDDASDIAARSFELERFDASRIAEYGARVGRNEVMLQTRPTTEEIIRTAPRIAQISLTGADAKNAVGALEVAKADIVLDAPLDDVPQKVTARFSNLNATGAADTSFRRLLEAAALDRLEGSGMASLSFDLTRRELALDALKVKFEGVGAVHAKGAFGEVDPTLAMSAGAAMFEKFSSIVLEPFRFTIENDGGFETLLKRAAARAGQPEDQFRAALAERTQEEFARLFGPPAVQSAAALAGFIREPRSIVVSVDPRDAEVRLIDFLQSLNLGPAGIAQTIDVRVFNRR